MEQLQKYEMKPSGSSEPIVIEDDEENTSEKDKALLNLMMSIERPFTVNQMQPQIKGYSKKDLEVALDRLVLKNDVLCKTVNRTKIYYYNYKSASHQEKVKESEELDLRIQQLTEGNAEKEQQIKELEESIANPIAPQPLKDIEDEAQELQARVDQLKKEIAEKKAKANAPVERKETNELKRKYDNYLDEFQKRKRMCLRVVDVVADNYVKTKKALITEMELETDEECNFNINDYKL